MHEYDLNQPTVIVVCVRADEETPWKATNFVGECSACGVAIQFRPHVPPLATKMCVRCFTERQNPDEDRYVVSTRTLQEIEIERRKN